MFGLAHKFKLQTSSICRFLFRVEILQYSYFLTSQKRLISILQSLLNTIINLHNPKSWRDFCVRKDSMSLKNVQIDRKYIKWIWNFICNQNGCYVGITGDYTDQSLYWFHCTIIQCLKMN